MKKPILCKLNLHKYYNDGLVKYEYDLSGESPYIVGTYKLICHKCRNVTFRQFSVPYGPGTKYTKKDVLYYMKRFK